MPLSVTASGKAWLATFGLERAIECIEANGGFAQADRYGPKATRSVDAFGLADRYVLASFEDAPRVAAGIALKRTVRMPRLDDVFNAEVADYRAPWTPGVLGHSGRDCSRGRR